MKTLRTKRTGLIEEAKSLYALADEENRSLSEEESTRFDALMTEAETLKADIERKERLAEEERSLEASSGRIIGQTRTVLNQVDSAIRAWLLEGTDKRANDQQLAAMAAMGLSGRKSMTLDLRDDALRSNEDPYAWATRAQGTTPLAAGGALVAPDFQRELEVALLTFGGLRGAARVIRTATGAELPFPTLNDTNNKGRRLSEHQEHQEQDLEFAQTVLRAHKYSSDVVRVSVELLQDSAINLPAEIGRALGERIGRIQSEEMTRTGTGAADQPQAIINGASLGVEGASATTVTYEEVLSLVHSVDPAYRSGAKFMFNDATLRVLRTLRDDDGTLIWQPGMVAGAPDRILGYEYVINQDMPDMAAEAISIVFGDLSKYIVRDVREITVVRLDEVYALHGQVGYLAFARSDGRVLDAGTGPIKFFQNAA
jgi:HK97 family phage major capsid protein